MTVPLEATLEHATTLARAGNLIDALKLCLSAVPGAAPPDRSLIHAAIRYFVALPLPRTSTEAAIATALLAELTELSGVAIRPSRPEHGAPGRVNVLLACRPPGSPRSFGTVAELMIDSQPASRRRVIRGGDASLQSAFETGVHAAVACLHRQGFGSLDSSLLLNARSFEGALRDLEQVVIGDSIGLGVAVAAISAALGIPVSSAVAFSGAIGIDGRLGTVDELQVKIAAAADKGLQEVVVAGGSAVSSDADIIVTRRETLDEVIGSLFTATQWAEAVARSKGAGVPAELRERHWPEHDESSGDVALLSIVGRNDPRGTPRPRHAGETIEIEDGPVLALASELMPQRVGLLHTRDLVDQARETEFALRDRHGLSGDAVTVHELPPQTVPNDAESVFPAVRSAVLQWLEQLEPAGLRVCTNVTAGTPQMTLALHLLVERGVLPDCRYQVMESRDVGADGRRARRIALPVL